MENATQFVHGTPKLAASQRTYVGVSVRRMFGGSTHVVLPFVRDMSVEWRIHALAICLCHKFFTNNTIELP